MEEIEYPQYIMSFLASVLVLSTWSGMTVRLRKASSGHSYKWWLWLRVSRIEADTVQLRLWMTLISGLNFEPLACCNSDDCLAYVVHALGPILMRHYDCWLYLWLLPCTCLMLTDDHLKDVWFTSLGYLVMFMCLLPVWNLNLLWRMVNWMNNWFALSSLILKYYGCLILCQKLGYVHLTLKMTIKCSIHMASTFLVGIREWIFWFYSSE